MKKPSVKHTATYWLNQVNNNPEKFGRTKKEIRAIDKIVERADKESD